MSYLAFAFFSGLLVFAGVYLAKKQGYFALRAANVIPIADAKDEDQVTLKGKVRVLESTTAPYSGRACAGFQLIIQQFKRSAVTATGGGSIGNGHWKKVHEESVCLDFELIDEAGDHSVVEGEKSKLLLTRDSTAATGAWSSGQVEEFLKERNLELKGFFGNKNFRILEGVLEEGETVTINGKARWEADPDAQQAGGYRGGEIPKRLRIVAGDGHVLVRDR